MAKTTISFGEWMPNVPPNENNGLTDAENVIPMGSWYEPVYGISRGTASSIVSVSGNNFVLYATKNNQGTAFNFIGGDHRLYRIRRLADLNSYNAGSTASYTTTGHDQPVFHFEQWGNRVLAANYSETPLLQFDMSITSTTDTLFSTVTATTAPPGSSSMMVVKDFLVLGNTYSNSSGYMPNRVHWSGYNNISQWTPDAATQCDFQDLLIGGSTRIQMMFGGEEGIIFMDNSIWKMTYVGSPVIFQFNCLDSNHGMLYRRGGVRVGEDIYFVGRDNFYVFRGGVSIPIGKGVYEEYLKSNIQATAYENGHSVVKDPNRPIIYWFYIQGDRGTPLFKHKMFCL